MFAVIKIECIGNPRQGFSPAWVREVVGFGERGLEYHELKGQMDYSEANSVASRGAYKRFFVKPCRLYHVSSPKTWRRTDEYFCTISDRGEICRMAFDEALKWLQNNL